MPTCRNCHLDIDEMAFTSKFQSLLIMYLSKSRVVAPSSSSRRRNSSSMYFGGRADNSFLRAGRKTRKPSKDFARESIT